MARHPHHRDILMALVSYEIEASDLVKPLDRAELINRLEPDRPDVIQLLAKLRNQ